MTQLRLYAAGHPAVQPYAPPGGALNIAADASHTVIVNADSTSTTGSSDGGVGIGAAIGVTFADSRAALSGTATLGGSTVTVDGRVTTGNTTIDAKAGRSGGAASNADIGVAGSFALGINRVNAFAALEPTANIALSTIILY